MLTPGQKIKAMMAEFDSDSESDNGSSNPTSKSKPQPPKHSIFNRPHFATQPDEENDDVGENGNEDEDEDDDVIMPRGRMAARLQAENQTGEADASTNPDSAMERVSRSLRAEKERDEDAAGSSDDDVPTAGPRRKLATAKISEEREDGEGRAPSRERSFSPLFVSDSENGEEQSEKESDGSDGDRPQPKRNARFEALIAKKRAEREEKEKQEKQKKKERAEAARLAAANDDVEDEEDDMELEPTRESARAARPARKASRKALDDMNRETQRMSRNLQLAHQATTSKKISKESFFARFNFMQPEQQKGPSDNSSATAGSQNSSDEEAQRNRETPQTSPVVGPADKPTTQAASTEPAPEDAQFPSLGKMVEQAPQAPEQPVVGRVEDHAANPAPNTVDVKGKKKLAAAPSIHVRLSRQTVAQNQMDDSDSDLEVVTSPAKSRRLAAFENVPSKKLQESSALIKLKALAHLTSPTRRTTMNNAELSVSLVHQAKLQAAKERQEKIAALRAKGVIIETAAERAAMEDELENLVEKARKEAEDIAKQERSASKKENGDMDDDDEDEDYEGSEDEADDDGENQDDDEDEDGEKEHNLFDSEAGEEDESEDDRSEVMSTGEPEITAQRRKRPTRVIDDDDDEDEVQAPTTPAPTTPARPINATPVSVERPQIPGMPSDDKTMSLTQVFAGTLGGSQQDSQPPSSTIPHSLPDPAQWGEGWQESDSQVIVKDSQEPRAESTDFLARYTPSDARVSESPAPRAMSQFSQIPDPTQDEGFVLSPFDPSKRFMGTPASTVETVLVKRDQSQSNSPVPERKMKHLRRGRTDLSAIEEEENGFEVDASAFNVMKKAAKKPNVAFDRKKSKAKDVVEEAAEESEDEYAGLGGASDEEEDEENVYDRQMINDNSGETVDEKQLAALNA